ncbi:MAG: DNA starvation/stationary phase protection protein Dps [Myxococcales bacterium]|nr:DNA starvation/stationary phase protection protein Dps [Myxococcales bacterium]
MQFNTRIDLPESTRQAVVERLNLHLANTLDLRSQVKQAHWTLKGPQFFARHQLFDHVAEHLEAQADELAERISTLGGYPRGTTHLVAATSIITRFDTGNVVGSRLIKDLIDRFALHAKVIREMLEPVDRDDPASADMLTSQLRAVELDLWFFESHFNA